jgi:uncharacterized protein
MMPNIIFTWNNRTGKPAFALPGMKNKILIKKASRFARKSLENAEGGHDWLHVKRVLINSRRIMKKIKANKTIVSLGLIFHDLADPKFSNGDPEKGMKLITAFLDETGVKEKKGERILDIVRNISYNGGFSKGGKLSRELKIAQDADRLDALGAIGIARTFHYGGYTGRKIYEPHVKPVKYSSEKEYRDSGAPSINHFAEKLLKLKKGMHTRPAKALARNRHTFLVKYLRQFKREISGKI